MAGGSEESGSPCGSGAPSQIIYAWARDAPKLELPEGVGFKVGKDSPIQYIVLQVHYAHIDKFKGKSCGASERETRKSSCSVCVRFVLVCLSKLS